MEKSKSDSAENTEQSASGISNVKEEGKTVGNSSFSLKYSYVYICINGSILI